MTDKSSTGLVTVSEIVFRARGSFKWSLTLDSLSAAIEDRFVTTAAGVCAEELEVPGSFDPDPETY